MDDEAKNKLVVKFPEGDKGSVSSAAPSNPVDAAADFLPRALHAIRGNFREAVFLFGMLGYIFIAAFGHMEKIQNYIGYFFVLLVIILAYFLWDKIKVRDILYLLIIACLIFYILFINFSPTLMSLLK